MNQTPQDWLTAFSTALSAQDIPAITLLFHETCYWRDLLTFTWNIKTMEGRADIAAMLVETLRRTSPTGWRITEPPEREGDHTHVWLAFETASAHGIGRVTLRDGKAITLMTAMSDIKGHEEPRGVKRPKGIVHKADRNRRTWSESRADETARLGAQDQPYALVIGGSQGGLALGARLKQLGVPTLIVERNARAGDSWRNRYRSLVLHDPVWYDHMPYLPFPDNWPVFTPKDKMGDWLDAYASIFELDLWTSTTCDMATWNEASQDWLVTVTRNGKPVTLRPKHLIFATGAYGPPKKLDWPGIDCFNGTLLHSSAYAGAANFKGKRAVVIGSSSSAHDVAVDLWEAGADVTMIQRSPTVVVRSETLMDLGFDIYSEAAVARGINVDKADLIAAATPMAVTVDQQKALYKIVRSRDAAFYDRLAASGFALTFGPDDSGLMMQAMRTASGYYIDVGASEWPSGPCRRHHCLHRLSVDERNRSRACLARGRRCHWSLLGSWLGHHRRPWPLAGRTAQHVEADCCAQLVVSRRKLGPVTLLFALCRLAIEGADGRTVDASLRTPLAALGSDEDSRA